MTMAAPETLVEATGLVRDYGRQRAVDGVDIRVERGQALGLLGPNGAGKTSTLGMLCGTLAPTAGSVRIAGFDLIDQPRQAKRRLGYLPEFPPLYPEMTVAEYLAFCARLHGLRKPREAQAVATAVDRCGLGAVRDRLIGQLSKGFSQRTGIAQAILHDPEVVILDEPTVALDPIQVREIRALISELARDHALILSSHLLPEIQAMCSHVQILHHGRIAWQDAVATLIHDEDAVWITVGIDPNQPLPDDLPGVIEATPLGQGRYRVHLDPAVVAAEDLAATLVHQSLGLREFTPEQPSLEQIFVEVTATGTGTSEAAAA